MVSHICTTSESRRRRHGRILLQDIACSLGEVINLSASGMRVKTRQAPEVGASDIAVTLDTFNGPLLLPVNIMWVKKAGWGKQLVGMQFREIAPEVRRQLVELARSAVHNECMREGKRGPDDDHN